MQFLIIFLIIILIKSVENLGSIVEKIEHQEMQNVCFKIVSFRQEKEKLNHEISTISHNDNTHCHINVHKRRISHVAKTEREGTRK